MSDFQPRLATIPYGNGFIKAVEVTPREYMVYPASFAEVISKPRNDFERFIQSKKKEAQHYKDNGSKQTIQDGTRAVTVTLYPLEAGVAYWSYHASKGYEPAEATMRSSVESDLKQALDGAFGNKQTDAVYQEERQAQYEAILARINRKIEVMNLRQSDGITDEQYQALVAEEEQLKKQMSYQEQDLAHEERNVVTLTRLVKEAPVSEVREPLQRELAWHTKNRDRLRQAMKQLVR